VDPTSWIVYGAVIGIWFVIAALAPRQAAWFVMLWVPVQGWVQLNLLENSNATVLVYEYLIVGLYLAFTIRALKSPKTFGPPSILAFAVPFVVWAILLIPSSLVQSGLVLTMIGLRTYLLPLPLVWVGYYAFRNRAELESVGAILLVETSIIGLVAALQFANLVTSSGAVSEVPTGYVMVGTLRPPGTFSSPAHLGMYVVAMIPLAVGFMGLQTTWPRRLSYAMGLAGAVLALVVNSQRSAVVLLCVCLPVLLPLARKVSALRVVALSLCVAVGGAAYGLSVVEGAFTERVRSISDDANYTLLVAPVERMTDALQKALTGGGLGSASPGVSRLELPPANSSESFMAALVYQLGLPGLLLFYLYLAALAIGGFRALQKCRRQDVGLLAAAILVYEIAIVLQSWSYDPLHYPPSRVIFWFWAGVLISLPQVARSQPQLIERQLKSSAIPGQTGLGRAGGAERVRAVRFR
jgi:hypothetical protein